MVTVPNVSPDTPALRKNPVFMYFQDGFQKPNPFSPDVAMSIDDVIDKKIDMLDAHVSQMYEWLPWLDGNLDQVPKGSGRPQAWLKNSRSRRLAGDTQDVARWYGADVDKNTNAAEAFEVCEYGARPDDAMMRKLFPFAAPNTENVDAVTDDTESGHGRTRITRINLGQVSAESRSGTHGHNY